jgi:hypothetical protein
MDVLYRCCCGIDVHKDTVAACVPCLGVRRCSETEAHLRHNDGQSIRNLLRKAISTLDMRACVPSGERATLRYRRS